MVNNWLNIIQDKLFPPNCIFCGADGFKSMDLCQHCLEGLALNQNCCYRCAEPFETAASTPRLCGHCLSKPPLFDETTAPFLYRREMRYLITGLKFGGQYKNARLLGMLMARHIESRLELPERLIPVPLHKARYRQRGFNQSIEIAKTLSRELSVPLELNSCIRRRNTEHQSRLPGKQRRKNMNKAFMLNQSIACRHVAIVDDVMTTGATAEALAHTLKQDGVERVQVWVCARA
ncbi:ComF family protein [Methylomarinum sp. Ch1-1]|uniref:ComF family protein n=1 Tax=Methylomarinum roseum TaxID=3067653 RepID=A0AAU7NZP1_9GAMM|nr:ComF family protein [Methylomarinum sp. Ch1-1]MDP4521345.1 ComF family protein [Methylomarinum sp. Ch1-1]